MRSGGRFNIWWWVSYLAAPLILVTALVIRPKLSKKLIGVLLVASMLSHCAVSITAVRAKYAAWHEAAQTEEEHERATMFSETEAAFAFVWCGEAFFYPLIVLGIGLVIVGKRRRARAPPENPNDLPDAGMAP